MGFLGTQGVHYKKWCSTVEQVCEEKFKGAKKALQAARAAGRDSVTPTALNNTLNDANAMSGFSEELIGLLMQQTTGTVWTALDNIKHMDLAGLEAWRAIHQGCNPKNNQKAEEIREKITKALPRGRAKDMPEVKGRLIEFDADVRAYDEVADKPLEENIKLWGLKAMVPVDVKNKIDLERDAEDYHSIRK